MWTHHKETFYLYDGIEKEAAAKKAAAAKKKQEEEESARYKPGSYE